MKLSDLTTIKTAPNNLYEHLREACQIQGNKYFDMGFRFNQFIVTKKGKEYVTYEPNGSIKFPDKDSLLNYVARETYDNVEANEDFYYDTEDNLSEMKDDELLYIFEGTFGCSCVKSVIIRNDEDIKNEILD